MTPLLYAIVGWFIGLCISVVPMKVTQGVLGTFAQGSDEGSDLIVEIVSLAAYIAAVLFFRYTLWPLLVLPPSEPVVTALSSLMAYA